MEKYSKILVLGHEGLVGSAVVRELEKQGYKNIKVPEKKLWNSIRYDLRNPEEVSMVFHTTQPEYVFLCAAKVGGIGINNERSAEMTYDNLMIQTNVIEQCRIHNVKKMLFLGSSCIYPKITSQPIKEEYLLTGKMEPTNIGYAVSKIAGLTMCDMYRKQYGCNFISAMPTNLYGPGDNFHLENSHVLPALIRKFHEAKKEGKELVELWGTGTPQREFLYIDDLAEALVFLMTDYNEPGIVNVGTGVDVSIRKLSEIIKNIVGYEGDVIWDTTKPDGTMRKRLDVSKLSDLGWDFKTTLETGIEKTYKWFNENYDKTRL